MRIFLSALIFLSIASNAQVYTWVNSEGVKEYGDEPPASASKANLPALQTMPTKKNPPKVERLSPKKQEVENGFSGYSQLSIISPKEDQMITSADAGNANIQLSIQPPLQAHHEITLFMDGKKVAEGPQLYFEIKNIFRGSHILQAKIKYQGKHLISSPKRRIHIQRPSILNR